MNQVFLCVLFLGFVTTVVGQSSYFPPVSGTWETRTPEALGWDSGALPPLKEFLDSEKTRAFIVLKDGLIVIEWYFGSFTADSVWYWASAAKTLTAFTVGIAVQDGVIDPDASSSRYTGVGWTSLTTEQEAQITVRHQLTMTTGLDDGVPENHCTSPSCLQYLTSPGSRWAYHNAPYTLLDAVIEKATGSTLNQYVISKVRNPAGMRGGFFAQGYNNIYVSDARSAARFGLLVLNRGNWDGKAILTDTAYFRKMVTPSQNFNPSYGYLWWLNGQSHYMLPGSQVKLQGMLAPSAPPDMFSAVGKNGQIISVTPSLNLVVVRFGDSADQSEVSLLLLRQIWDRLAPVVNTASANWVDKPEAASSFSVYPNPSSRQPVTLLPASGGRYRAEVFNVIGQRVAVVEGFGTAQIPSLRPGIYLVRFLQNGKQSLQRVSVLQ